ncbi:MAG: DNA translocase FtsK [Oscillospiraceae bacterium]|nr:DNA translocase FtsK [Oscillospiraceae bacterium]MDD7041132.1 DNA translocase FtsK [Oscillospiraceae bacterium]MDY2611170.1 DNA translocase FtsK [Oscillospiraceae bacterium]
MAEQKKRTAAKKKTTAAKKSTGRQTAAQKRLAEEQARSRRQLWAVILFAVGIFFLAVSLIPGQGFWNWLHTFCFGLFGWCAYLIAPALIYIAVMAAMDKPMGALGHKVWQTFVLVALICGAAQIFAKTPIEGENFVEKAAYLYESGTKLKGGGLAAGLIGIPLLSFGKTPAAVTVFLLIFTFLMLITGATLLDLIRSAYKPVQKIGETYVERVEERRRPQFNIDVPLDEDPLPAHPVRVEEQSEQSRETVKKAKEKLIQAAAGPQAGSDFAPAADEKKPEKKAAKEPPLLDDLVGKITKSIMAPAQPQADLPAAPTGCPAAEKAADEGQIAAEESAAETGADEKIAGELDAAKQLQSTESYIFPPVYLLKEGEQPDGQDLSEELKANAQLLVDALASFGVQTRIIDIARGPAVTRYELQPSAGVKISKITNLADDIALNLATSGVRIEAPIPNKAAVGIEVPNRQTSVVPIRDIIDSQAFREAKSKVTMCLGKDIGGSVCVADISKMPHMLIAGATGSGKSVCINSIIMSILFKASPEEVRLLMVDPKVVELGVYNGIPHLLVPVVTDPRKAAGALNWAVSEMLGRYKLFADNSVRDINGYNRLAEERPERNLAKMPQIVIIIDELADLMIAAQNEVEDAICRLAQMARAAGMHLVIATQRPSVDVITGVIKANIPSRIAFAVSSQVDSRTILDSGGAEKLLGKGDMLFFPVGAAKPIRIQGCFVSDKEVEKVVAFIKGSQTAEYDDQILEEIERQAEATGKSAGSGSGGGGFDADDEMLPAAIECVVETGQASTSLLQRKLKLGYARAARIIDEMESRGIVGPFEGSKPRQVLISRQQWIEMKMQADGTAPQKEE